MTEREIKELRDKIGTDPILTDEEIEYIWMAMDKDTALKPVDHIKEVCGTPEWYGTCSVCDEAVVEYFQYCPDCGQKLDWEDEE